MSERGVVPKTFVEKEVNGEASNILAITHERKADGEKEKAANCGSADPAAVKDVPNTHEPDAAEETKRQVLRGPA